MRNILFFLLLSHQSLIANPDFNDIGQTTNEVTVENEEEEAVVDQQDETSSENQQSSSDSPYPTSLESLSEDTLTRVKKPLSDLNVSSLVNLKMPDKFESGMVDGLKNWNEVSADYSKATSSVSEFFDQSWELIDEKESKEKFSKEALNSKEYFAYRLESYAEVTRIVEKLEALKKDVESSPELAKDLIAKFNEYLEDSKSKLKDSKEVLKNSEKDDSLVSYENQAKKNLVDYSFAEKGALASWKDILKGEQKDLNPLNWTFEKESPLVGQTLTLNKKIPYVLIYDRKLKNAKKYSPDGQKYDKTKYSDNLKGSLVTKTSSGSTRYASSKYGYQVMSIAKDGSGKTLGYVVRKLSQGKLVGQNMLIPHDSNTSTFPLSMKIQGKKPKFDAAAEGHSGDFKIPSFTFLTNLLIETQSQIDSLELKNDDAATAFKKNAYAVYQYCFHDKQAIAAYSQKELKTLLDLVGAIENAINIYLNKGIDQRINKEKAVFEVGTSQNILAICASIICEHYKFDDQAKNIILGNYAVDANVVRIGNFFAKGTNNKEDVSKANGVMSGQYSLVKMTPRDYMTDVTVDLYYKGLNPSSKGSENTNDYSIYVLNPQGSGYKDLLKCIATLNKLDKNGWTGYYKKPIKECIDDKTKPAFYTTSDDQIAFATVDGVSGKSSGMIDGITFNPQKKSFVIYQEAAGLSWAQDWVDYDEATMTAGMRIRKLEKVKKENFRIVLDGSGTMQGVFEKVIKGLESEFKDLKVPSLMNLKTTSLFGIQQDPEKYKAMGAELKASGAKGRLVDGVIRPIYFEAAKGPISLSDLKSEVPGGPSPLVAGMKKLIQAPSNAGGIPGEPWVLAIVSDFQSTDEFFKYQNWVSYFARNPIDGKKVHSLFRSKTVNGKSTFYINKSEGSIWKNLQEVQLISVNGIIANKSIKVASWMQSDKYFKKGDNGIYLFDKMTPKNFSDSMSKFMQPIKESVQGRSK
ncbi:MAG: hypothetical protein KC646_15905 [Candidatus Cloacimonetes bacterium]|nr:hypothetical protein [Candidatus Cloacimonadota bacterium]